MFAKNFVKCKTPLLHPEKVQKFVRVTTDHLVLERWYYKHLCRVQNSFGGCIRLSDYSEAHCLVTLSRSNGVWITQMTVKKGGLVYKRSQVNSRCFDQKSYRRQQQRQDNQKYASESAVVFGTALNMTFILSYLRLPKQLTH